MYPAKLTVSLVARCEHITTLDLSLGVGGASKKPPSKASVPTERNAFFAFSPSSILQFIQWLELQQP